MLISYYVNSMLSASYLLCPKVILGLFTSDSLEYFQSSTRVRVHLYIFMFMVRFWFGLVGGWQYLVMLSLMSSIL